MTEKEFLNAVKKADLRYFREAEQRAAEAESLLDTEEKHMKLKKGILITAAAAVLSVGGVTAAVAMHGKNVQNERDETSLIEVITTKPNIEETKTLGLHLTDDYIPPIAYSVGSHSRPQFVQSDTGWYYVKRTGLFEPVLYYTDAATVQSVPLCINPECKHDGNLYCTATTKAYYDKKLVWANGSLWCTATKSVHTDEVNSANYSKDARLVLLEYAPDGSSIREIADFGKSDLAFSAPIYYRGYLFFYMQKQIGVTVEVEDEFKNEKKVYRTIGYELIAYDLNTKKTVTVQSELPAEGSYQQYTMPEWFCGIGNDIYFYQYDDDWQQPYSQGLHRVSLITGETTDVGEKNVLTLSENEMLCLEPKPETKYPIEYEVHLKKLNSEEDTVLENLDVNNSYIMDENYIYCRDFDRETEHVSIMIYDKTGKERGKATLPKNDEVQNFAVLNGRIYAETKGRIEATENGGTLWLGDTPGYVHSCSIEDVLAGKAEWKTEFCVDEYVNTGKD